MARESYEMKLSRVNRLAKKREERGFSQSDLARKLGLKTIEIVRIEKGQEVSGGLAKEICRALRTRFTEVWVNFDGMIVVREKKSRGAREGCVCKLY
jgi:DNA-binding XRE family transcriptional regulator